MWIRLTFSNPTRKGILTHAAREHLRDPRRRGRHQRGQGRLARLLALARGTRALGGGARDLEMPTRGSSMRSARPYPGSPGSACRTHYLTGSLGQGGGVASSPCVATLVRTILDQLGRHRGHSLSSNGSPRRWLGSCLKMASTSSKPVVTCWPSGTSARWLVSFASTSIRDPRLDLRELQRCSSPIGRH